VNAFHLWRFVNELFDIAAKREPPFTTNDFAPNEEMRSLGLELYYGFLCDGSSDSKLTDDNAHIFKLYEETDHVKTTLCAS